MLDTDSINQEKQQELIKDLNADTPMTSMSSVEEHIEPHQDEEEEEGEILEEGEETDDIIKESAIEEVLQVSEYGDGEIESNQQQEVSISFSKEAWDDSELIDAWDKAVEEYKQYRDGGIQQPSMKNNKSVPNRQSASITKKNANSGPSNHQTGKKRSSSEILDPYIPNKRPSLKSTSSSLSYSAPVHQNQDTSDPKAVKGNYSTNHFEIPPLPSQTDSSFNSQDEKTNADTTPFPFLPTLATNNPVTSSAESQELLTKMMMSWYYAGYYAGQYAASLSKSDSTL